MSLKYVQHGFVMKKIVVFISLIYWFNFAFAKNNNDASHHYQLIEKHYTINRDLTYSLDVKKIIRIHDASMIKFAFQDSVQFNPQIESVRLNQAFVTHADKSKEFINKKLIHTRNLFSSQSTPGISSQLEQILLFPKIQTDDLVQSNWHIKSNIPSTLGLNILSDIDMPEQIDEEIIYLNMPKNITMHWQKRGDVSFKQSVNHNRRLVEVHIKHIPAIKHDDPLATAKQDRTPLFVASTLPGWEAIGKLYYQTAHDKAKITPKVRQLAAQIVGKKKGKEAAKAIYDWVAQNIKYVYLPLNAQAGFVPHYADEVLQNGFGDCKDHVTLMQALLAARGIKSEPVLIGWNNSFKKYPMTNPSQFNHVIIYLPDYDIYANPTSDASPFETLDIFLSGKFVVHAGTKPKTSITPAHQVKDNQYVIDTHINLGEDGSLNATGSINITGFADGMVRKLISGSQDKLDDVIKQMLAEGYEGGQGHISPKANVIEKNLQIDFDWHSPQAVEMADKLYFNIPRGIDFSAIKYINGMLQDENHSDRVLVASKFTWYYHIQVPKGYHLTSLPKDRVVKNQYGSFEVNYSDDGNQIVVKRQLVINQDVFSDKEYEALKEILLAVKFDSAATIVLTS
jgi:hypothetical protein